LKLNFIHGFLGRPSDWEKIKIYFKDFDLQFHSISDYILENNINHNNDFLNWSQNFNNSCLLNKSNHKNIIIGYSLGGRLALHSLISKNFQWDAAIIVSANPGLSNENEKKLRIEKDLHWSHRFLNENWVDVIKDWDSQPTFAGIQNTLVRKKEEINKNEIFDILNRFSLGKQNDLQESIEKLKIPILWVSGEKDTKFSSITNKIQALNSGIQIAIIPHAGHRVPWEAPKEFSDLCISFLSKL
jgi:2-succinyl-6-hydroxy-2,4-cyclohexadiene-1-carboxylate synthase